MKLTQEEKKIRILKAIGWTQVKVYQWDESNPSIRLPKQFHVDKCGVIHNAPDVFGNLNDMHEAENILKPEQHFTFQVELARVINTITYPLNFALLHATADERAEAFGLTLNLWEVGQ